MPKKVTQPHTQQVNETLLFRYVFSSVFTKGVNALLLAFLVLQPVAPVLANEEVVDVPEEQVIEEPVEENEEEIEDETSEDEVSEEAETEQEEEVQNEEADELPEEADEVAGEGSEMADDDETTEVATSTTEASDTESTNENSEDDESDESETASTTDSGTDTESEETNATSTTETTEDNDSGGSGSSGSSSNDDESEDGQSESEEQATSTDSVGDSSDEEAEENTNSTTTESVATSSVPIEEEIEVHVVDNSDALSFDAADCVIVADGSYYCAATEEEDAEVTEEQLFAKPDKDGDTEIYLFSDDELHKITDNLVDDRAPFFDPISNSIVWHRMVNDRYHIVSYNLELNEEVVITTNNTNNMEPTRMGDVTVWQRWIGDDWEIMFYDGENLEQLTDNDIHDVAPKIRDGHILWQTLGVNGEKLVSVYEIATGRLNTIDDADGGAIENPRLVLLYETTYENGDVVTRGYDFESGEIIPLTAVPAEVPDEIPDSDTTGETRALIQTKVQTRDEGKATSGPKETKKATSSKSSSTPAIPEDEPDVVVATTTPKWQERVATTTPERSSTTAHIADVVIQPRGSSTKPTAG